MDGIYLSLLLVPLVHQLRAVLMIKLLFVHVLTINDYHILLPPSLVLLSTDSRLERTELHAELSSELANRA